MGTMVRLVIHSADTGGAARAAAAAFSLVVRLDSLFSDYRPESEIAHLAQAAGTGVPLPVSDELWEVLQAGAAWGQRTEGVFDVTLGPLTRLWRWSVRRGVLPEPSRLAAARARSGASGLHLDPDARTAYLARPGMALDLGGIAKGFAAQAMLTQLTARGFAAALVDAGGDLALGDPPPGEAGWKVEFPNGETHRLRNVAVATSGDRYQALEVGGVRYSHIVDPRTGLGVPDAPTVVVVAPDATTADVLASALSVLDRRRGERLVAGLEGVAVWVTPRSGGGVAWQTEGFPTPRGRP